MEDWLITTIIVMIVLGIFFWKAEWLYNLRRK